MEFDTMKPEYTNVNSVIESASKLVIGFSEALSPLFYVVSEGKITFKKTTQQRNFYGNSGLKKVDSEQVTVPRKNTRIIRIRKLLFIDADLLVVLEDGSRYTLKEKHGFLQISVSQREYDLILSQLWHMEDKRNFD